MIGSASRRAGLSSPATRSSPVSSSGSSSTTARSSDDTRLSSPSHSVISILLIKREITGRWENCKVEIARYTINSKNLCIFALRGTCFPSKFSGSAAFSVVKGSHTDLHRFDPRRPYSIKTRIKTRISRHRRPIDASLADHIPLKQGLRPRLILLLGILSPTRRPYSIKTRIKTPLSYARRA